MNTNNTVINFSQYSDEELDLLIRGLSSIDVTEGAPESIGDFLMGQLKNGSIDRRNIEAKIEEIVEKKKEECVKTAEDIAVLKAKLITLRRERKAPVMAEAPVAGL